MTNFTNGDGGVAESYSTTANEYSPSSTGISYPTCFAWVEPGDGVWVLEGLRENFERMAAIQDYSLPRSEVLRRAGATFYYHCTKSPATDMQAMFFATPPDC